MLDFFPLGFFGLCMAWELELLYGFGDWSFYGFRDDWSFCAVNLMAGASVDLRERMLDFFLLGFLSMHWR